MRIFSNSTDCFIVSCGCNNPLNQLLQTHENQWRLGEFIDKRFHCPSNTPSLNSSPRREENIVWHNLKSNVVRRNSSHILFFFLCSAIPCIVVSAAIFFSLSPPPPAKQLAGANKSFCRFGPFFRMPYFLLSFVFCKSGKDLVFFSEATTTGTEK